MFLRHLNASRLMLAVLDAVTLNACFMLAFVLRFDGNIPAEYWAIYHDTAVWVTLSFVALGICFGLYNRIWEYASLDAVVVIVGTATATVFVTVGITALTAHSRYPYSVLAMVWCFLILAVGGARFGWRYLRERIYHTDRELRALRTRVLVYGAGDEGVMLARQMREDRASKYEVVGFVDDNAQLTNMYASGVKVLGTGDDLAGVIQRHKIEEVVAALPSADGGKLRELRDRCTSLGVNLRTLPRLLEMVNGGGPLNRVRAIDVADLLGRDTGRLTLTTQSDYLAGRTVLVTGAGGSIGSEICRQLCRYSPRTVVLLGRGENRIHRIFYELRDKHPQIDFVPVICNLTSREALGDVLQQHHPDVILHAGAHKHVYLMEVNAVEAVRNNVVGTATLADLAEAYGVERFIFISTDKAVAPTSIMGATKRLCERLLISRNGMARTKFMAVRFGNVIGSAGSVLPIFQAHAAAGRPIPVTHPEADRFFMTIEEAAFLVLQAGSLGEGGDLFVLDMGEPIKIVDVARTVLEFSGRDPSSADAIEFIGLRQGEKLHESLTSPWEALQPTECPLVLKLHVTGREPECMGVQEALEQLCAAIETCDEPAVRRVLAAATHAPSLAEDTDGSRVGAAV